MQIIKKLSIRFLVALLTFTLGVSATLLWVVSHFQSVSTQSAENISDTLKTENIPLPDGWKKLEIKNKVSMHVPEAMKPSRLIGDSFAYREAYNNQEIYITIVYGVIMPRRNERDRPFDACDTPASLLEEPTYHESVIDIDGRKANLSIDRHVQPKYNIAHVCFHPDDEGVQLIVVANCRDERALETAQQIFTSIRFSP